MSLAFDTFSVGTVAGIAIGAVGALTLEHGWGYVLARYHAYVATAKNKADSVYAEVTAQVEQATKDLTSRVVTLESDVAAVKAKVGA